MDTEVEATAEVQATATEGVCPINNPICFSNTKDKVSGEYKLCDLSGNSEGDAFFDKMISIRDKINNKGFVADTKTEGSFCASFDFAWLNAIEEFKRKLDLAFSGQQEKLPKEKNNEKINELKQKLATNENPLKEFFKLISDVMTQNNTIHKSRYITLFCDSINEGIGNPSEIPISATGVDKTAQDNIVAGIKGLIGGADGLITKIEAINPADSASASASVSSSQKIDKGTIDDVKKIIDIGKYTLNKSSHFDRNAFLAAGDLFGGGGGQKGGGFLKNLAITGAIFCFVIIVAVRAGLCFFTICISELLISIIDGGGKRTRRHQRDNKKRSTLKKMNKHLKKKRSTLKKKRRTLKKMNMKKKKSTRKRL
jgi:hypothetical protein